MGEVEIRAATVDDHAAINALAQDAWHVLKPGYDPQRWDELLTNVGKMSSLATEGRLLVDPHGQDTSQMQAALDHGPRRRPVPGSASPRWIDWKAAQSNGNPT